MVARDGIEPPTPAFSGPRSTTELPGLSADFVANSCTGSEQDRKDGLPRTVRCNNSASIATPFGCAKPADPFETGPTISSLRMNLAGSHRTLDGNYATSGLSPGMHFHCCGYGRILLPLRAPA